MTTLPNILIIVGPTASGKTSLAIEIAKHISSEIISADSRQVYKHLDIGTAKPSRDIRNTIPHHCIDIAEPHERYNAGGFQLQGRKIISDIVSRKKLPIVVGGTGLYVQALIDGFFEQPHNHGTARTELEARLKKKGHDVLYQELQQVDPISAATMDATKYRRVIRALEVYYETGTPISQFHANHRPQKIYNDYWVALEWKRSMLYQRIDERVDSMIQHGFLDEVRMLHAMGYDDTLQALQTVGYKEAFQYFRHHISYERMVELIKQNTRRYAKRQLTWFRKEQRIQWYSIENECEIPAIALKVAKRFGGNTK